MTHTHTGRATFIGKPDDVDGLVKSIESQKKAIFAA